MKTNWRILNTVSNKLTGEITEVNYEYSTCCDRRTSVRVSSVIQLAPSNTESFIPYEGLTEVIVIGWVKALLGVETITYIEDKSAVMFETLASKVKEVTVNGTPWRPTNMLPPLIPTTQI